MENMPNQFPFPVGKEQEDNMNVAESRSNYKTVWAGLTAPKAWIHHCQPREQQQLCRVGWLPWAVLLACCRVRVKL